MIPVMPMTRRRLENVSLHFVKNMGRMLRTRALAGIYKHLGELVSDRKVNGKMFCQNTPFRADSVIYGNFEGLQLLACKRSTVPEPLIKVLRKMLPCSKNSARKRMKF